ncbi:MAG: cyclic 2,3-diphosphoglycerate synthase [Candidatus Aenigmatarchaeota archaeon]
MKRINTIIMGAAGRDFHNFNMVFRNNKYYKVVAFTATQIPDIAGRRYPSSLSGRLYPKGIPIFEEKLLAQLIKKYKIDYVFFSYSDIAHVDVMHKASLVLANGANFAFLGPNDTMLKSTKPVIAVCAVRTGAGKSQTSRRIVDILRKIGLRVVVIRHPMPYGDLAKQAVQRFASYRDLERQQCTIEEREEYEPHLEKGVIVYAGVDYEKILRKAEKECDIIIFDGGNNDFSFIKADLYITVADPQRAGHEIAYHPGEVNFRCADVLVINKMDSADPKNVKIVIENIKKYNPGAIVVKANSSLIIDKPELIKGRKVLVVEDGPTLTHGGMSFGAGTLAAKKYKATIINAEKYAVGSIKDVYRKYTHLKNILPAMGYSNKQVSELEKTINRSRCDVVVDGSPINLSRLIKVNKPVTNVRYYLDEIGSPNLETIIRKFLKKRR